MTARKQATHQSRDREGAVRTVMRGTCSRTLIQMKLNESEAMCAFGAPRRLKPAARE